MTLIVQDNKNKVRFTVEATSKSDAIVAAHRKLGVSMDLKIYQPSKSGTLRRL